MSRTGTLLALPILGMVLGASNPATADAQDVPYDAHLDRAIVEYDDALIDAMDWDGWEVDEVQYWRSPSYRYRGAWGPRYYYRSPYTYYYRAPGYRYYRYPGSYYYRYPGYRYRPGWGYGRGRGGFSIWF